MAFAITCDSILLHHNDERNIVLRSTHESTAYSRVANCHAFDVTIALSDSHAREGNLTGNVYFIVSLKLATPKTPGYFANPTDYVKGN